MPSEQLQRDRGEHHTDRSDRVGEHFEVGALHVERLLGALAEQEEGDQVHDESDRGDDEHRDAQHLGLVEQPSRRLHHHVDGDREEQERVDERGEDLESVQPERVLAGWLPVANGTVDAARAVVPTGELDRGQGHPEADDVGQHVPGVRQQCQRVGEEAGNGFDDEERGDQTEGDRQRADDGGRRPAPAPARANVHWRGCGSPLMECDPVGTPRTAR